MRNPAAGGSSYVEVGNLGFTTDAGNNASNSSPDFKYTSPVTIPAGGVWAKTFYLTVNNATSGGVFRPVLYTGSGSSTDPLFKQGEQYTSPANIVNTITELGPINWNSDGSALFIPAGTYLMGIITGPSGFYGIRSANGTSGNLKRTTDTYSDGASATYGTVSAFGSSIRMRMPYSLGGP